MRLQLVELTIVIVFITAFLIVSFISCNEFWILLLAKFSVHLHYVVSLRYYGSPIGHKSALVLELSYF